MKIGQLVTVHRLREDVLIRCLNLTGTVTHVFPMEEPNNLDGARVEFADGTRLSFFHDLNPAGPHEVPFFGPPPSSLPPTPNIPTETR